MEPRTRFIITGIAAVAASALAGYLWHTLPSDPLSSAAYSRMSLTERESYWHERIQRLGSTRAYAEFPAVVTDMTTPQKHLNAHIFGRELYDTVGMAGITTCDGKYSYGCFHAFMIRAVEDRGIGAGQELYDACRDTLGETAEQCEHGIGHGILGITGYGMQDVDTAIAKCDGLVPKDNLVGGCAGGVFMEYGLRGMQGLGLAAHRPFSESEALLPCATLADPTYASSCAYWQPMWWMETDPEREDDERMARKMGEWCAQMPGGRAALSACIAGIANRMQLLTNEDPSASAGICRVVTADPSLQEYCQRQSAQRYTVYYPLEFSLRACDGLPDERRDRCRQDATAASESRRRDQERNR